MRSGPPRPRCAPHSTQNHCAMLAAERIAPPAAPPTKPLTRTLSVAPTGLRLKANQDRNRLCRGCAALHIMKGEGEQRICFRVISADRAGRYTMGLCPEAADHAALVISQRFDFDQVAFGNAAGAH